MSAMREQNINSQIQSDVLIYNLLSLIPTVFENNKVHVSNYKWKSQLVKLYMSSFTAIARCIGSLQYV